MDAGMRVESVSAVVNYIKKVISQNKNLASIAVRGEVSALTQSSGRFYFDLKENADILKCVVWAKEALKLPPFQNGNEVIVSGEFGTFAPRSQYQLFVTSLELSGAGRLHAKFEALKVQYRSEGLFEPSRKRPMPNFPMRIALVSTRGGGKGAQDFVHTMKDRAAHISMELVETRMQGDGAEIDIADAIDRACALDVDVVVVLRGGGSFEELFPFNLEPVVRAIVRATRPVLMAIGHTGDRFIADEVADLSIGTPSNAAQYFGEIRDAHVLRLEALSRDIKSGVGAVLRAHTQRYDTVSERIARLSTALVGSRNQRLLIVERRLNAQNPSAQLAARARKLSPLAGRLNVALSNVMTGKRRRVDSGRESLRRVRVEISRRGENRIRSLEARLNRFDPEAALKLGYAIVYAGGKLLRDASSVAAGSTITAKLSRGTVLARVEESMHDD